MKREEFRALAEDVCRCHLCENLLTLPHRTDSERLINDGHGLAEGHPYVNRWNLWHGNLDAEIMVIGQDYGRAEKGPPLEVCKYTDTTDFTDVKLKQLFSEAFGLNLDENKSPLFFTNMANCYRQNRTSGGAHSAWLPICANKFMERLIRIVRPKIIIVLGRAAFEALHCMDGLPVICEDPQTRGKDSFADIIRHHYHLTLDGEAVPVFPVFHPGANSQINRPFPQQQKDWQRIATESGWKK